MNTYIGTFTDAQLRERLATYIEQMNYHFVCRSDAPKWRKDAIADGIAVVRREMNRRGIK
jgi:hypothetical protein